MTGTPPPAHGEPLRSFGPTSGTALGVVTLLALVVVAVVVLLDEVSLDSVRVALGALVGATLVWAYLLRPRVLLGPDRVVLRNAFTDDTVPYAAVEEVAVGSVLVVRAGGRKHVGTAVGHAVRRQLRSMAGRTRGAVPTGGPTTSLSGRLLGDQVPSFVEQQITAGAEDARLRLPPDQPPPATTRAYALPELLALTALLLAFVVALVV